MKFNVTPGDGGPIVQAASDPKNPANHRIVLGSPKGGCGKTSTSLFIGTTLAELGQSVLLVEMTEGQAPLSQSFAYEEANAADGGRGIGLTMHRLIGRIRDDEDYTTALRRLLPVARQEAPTLLDAIVSVSIDPDDPTKVMHFCPCAEGALAEVSSSSRMRQRPIRRALLDAILIALAEAREARDGIRGWDTIIMDVLPSAESPVMKAAVGVSDSYALLVDMRSAQPLPGWGIIQEEIAQVEAARKAEGKENGIFKGLILNMVAAGSVKKAPRTERINRLKIRLLQRMAQEEGLDVPILADIRILNTLGLLGFNSFALRELTKNYPGGIPEDLDDLTDEDLEKLVCFTSSTSPDGKALEVGTGRAWLAAMAPSMKKTLAEETNLLMPLILALSNDNEALEAFLSLYQAEPASA